MPLSSTVSCKHQRWIVCALCSWAFAIISYKNSWYNTIAEIVGSVTEMKKKPSGDCPYWFSDSSWESRTLPFYLPDIYWNPRIIDIADSAFNTGKLLMVVPSGVLSDLGYSRYVLGGGMFLVAAEHLLRPTTINMGVGVFTIKNFLEGVGEASIIPSVVSLISRWTPSSERNTFTALIVAGLYYGDVLGDIVYHLIHVGFISWSSGQYTTGAIGVVWLVFGFIFIYHSPDESPFVSPQEYHNVARRNRRSLMSRLYSLKNIPWGKIASSRPFICLVLVYCSSEWAVEMNIYTTLESYQPYMLHLPKRFTTGASVALTAAIPSLVIGGFLTDWIINHNVTSKKVIKRTFVFISVFFSSVLLVVATCLVGCHITLFWVFTCTAIYVSGLATSLVYAAPVDLSHRHAGLLMAIISGVRTVLYILDTKINELLVTDESNPDELRVKSLYCAVVAIVTMIPFIFFGSVERQHWRSPLDRRQSLDHPPIELGTSAVSNPNEKFE